MEAPVIAEQYFNRPISEVWSAISEPEKMQKWFFDTIESFKPETGFETSFNVKTPNAEFLHLWKLTEVVPEKKIVYDWRYKDYAGRSIVTFELFEIENQTLLRVTHINPEPYNPDIIEFRRESCQGGWDYFIKESLKNYLA